MQPDRQQKEQARPVTEEQDRRALESNREMTPGQVAAAHDQAEKDMDADAEFTAASPNDDLDEGETARLGEDDTLLI